MPVYQLPAKQAVADAVAARLPVADRLIALWTGQGNIIGPGGVQVYPDGSVTIDTNNDPTAAWNAWNPTILSPQEQAAVALKQKVQSARNQLQMIEDRTQPEDPNPTLGEVKQALRILSDILDDLIGVLLNRGVFD